MPTTTARSLRWEGDPYFHGGIKYGIRDHSSQYADQAANDLIQELQSKGYDPTTGGSLLKNETDSFSVGEDRYSLIPHHESLYESRYDHPDAQVAHPPSPPRGPHNDDDATRDPSYYLNSSSTSYSTQNDKTTFETSYDDDCTKGSYTDESGTSYSDDADYSDMDNGTTGSRKTATSLQNPLRRAPPKTSAIPAPKVVVNNSTAPKRPVPPVATGRRDQATTSTPLRPLPTQNHGTTTTTTAKNNNNNNNNNKTPQVPPSTSYMSFKSESTSSLSRFQELQRKKQKVKDLVKRFERKEAFVPRHANNSTDVKQDFQQQPRPDPPERPGLNSRPADDNKPSTMVPQRANLAPPKTKQGQPQTTSPKRIVVPKQERPKPSTLAIETREDDFSVEVGIPPPHRHKLTTKSLVDMMESPHSTAEPLSPTLRTANGRSAMFTQDQATKQQKTNGLQPIQEKNPNNSSLIDDSIHIHSQENMPPSPTGKKRGLWSRLVQPKSKSTGTESQPPMATPSSFPSPSMPRSNNDCQLVTREQLFQELEREGLPTTQRQQPYRRWNSDTAGSLVGKMISPNKQREIVMEPLTTTNSDWSLVSRESECLSENNSLDNDDENVLPSKGPFRNMQKGFFMKRFRKAPDNHELMDSDVDSELDDHKQVPTPAAAAAVAIEPAPHRHVTQLEMPPNKGLLPADLEMIKAGKAGRGKRVFSTGPPSDQASRGSSILPNIERSDISSHNDSSTSDAISESGVETVLEQTLSPKTRKTNLFLDTAAHDSNLGAIYVRPSPKAATTMKTTMAGIVKKMSTRMHSPQKSSAAGVKPISSPIGIETAKETRLLPPRHNKIPTPKAATTNTQSPKQDRNTPTGTPGRRMIRLLGQEKDQQSGFPFMSNPSADDHSNHVTAVPRTSSSIGSYEDQSIEIIDGSQQGITLTFSGDDGSTNQNSINQHNAEVTNPSTKMPNASSSGSVILKTTMMKLESMRKAEPVIVETVQSKSDSESTSSIGLNSNKGPPMARTPPIPQTPNKNTLSSRVENNNGKSSSPTDIPAETSQAKSSNAATSNKPTNHESLSSPSPPKEFDGRPSIEMNGRLQPLRSEIRQNKDSLGRTSAVQGETDVDYEEKFEVDLSWHADPRDNRIEHGVDQTGQDFRNDVETSSSSQRPKSESPFPNLLRRAFQKKKQPETRRSLTEMTESHPRVVKSPRHVRLASEQDEPPSSSHIETQPLQGDTTRSLNSSTSPPIAEPSEAVHDKKAVRFSEEPAVIHEIPAIQSGSVTIDSSSRGGSSSPTPSEDTFSSTSSSTTSGNSNTSTDIARPEPKKKKGMLSFVRRTPNRLPSKRESTRDRMDNSSDRSSLLRQGVPNTERRSTGSPGHATEDEEGIELIARRSKTGKNAILISKSDGKSQKDSSQASRSRSRSRSRSPYRRNMTAPKGKNSLMGNRLFGQRTNKPGKRGQAQAQLRAQRNQGLPGYHDAGTTESSNRVYHPVATSGTESRNNVVAENSDQLQRLGTNPTKIATNPSTLLAESVATDEAEPGSSVGTDQSTDSSLRMNTSTSVEQTGGDFLSWLLPGIFGPIPAKAPPRRPSMAGMRAHADELSSQSSSSSSRMIGNEEWLEILRATETLALQYQEAQNMDEASGKSISEETIRNVNTAIATFKEYARRFGIDEKQLMEAVRDDDRSLHSSKQSSVSGKKIVGSADKFLQMFEYYFSPDDGGESTQPGSINSTAHYT